ncbi:retrovirus-related pol polyprotein from transposon TNT 1-94 [Tanacetum coccineum]
MSKAKRSSFKSKVVPSSKGRLNLLHMDLCGPMRVASINGKKYILVIVDDYSRYTWTLFLRSKDETPEVLKDHHTMIQRIFKLNTSTPRTPKQNGVVERWNRTLVKAARTMLSASKLSLSFWAEAVATTCYTQNRSIIISAHGKTVNPAHSHAKDNNNDQAPNASFQEDEFINPFCTRVQEIGESSSRNIDNTDVHSFQPQSDDFQ